MRDAEPQTPFRKRVFQIREQVVDKVRLPKLERRWAHLKFPQTPNEGGDEIDDMVAKHLLSGPDMNKSPQILALNVRHDFYHCAQGRAESKSNVHRLLNSNG